MLPLLFNIYSEIIFKEVLLLEGVTGDIKINGKAINNIRYANDTIVLAENIQDLQDMMDRIVQCSESFDLSMNTAKTKVLVFSKTPMHVHLTIKGITVEQVPSFKYLGTIVTNQNYPKKEIRSRIEQARRTFVRMRKFFTRSDLSLELRVRMIRCYVFSVLLCGCESWTLDPATERKLGAFEMYLYCRMLRILWVRKITNEEVCENRRNSHACIKERKTRYIGHLMRGEKYELLRLIIEGKIQGKRSIGRRQNSWPKDIRKWLGCTSVDIFRMPYLRSC